MPQLASSKKALRQSLRRRDRNRARKKAMKLASRAALDAAQAGDAESLGAALTTAQKTIDKAARSGAIHKRTAARRKSRLMKRVNALAPAQSGEQ